MNEHTLTVPTGYRVLSFVITTNSSYIIPSVSYSLNASNNPILRVACMPYADFTFAYKIKVNYIKD